MYFVGLPGREKMTYQAKVKALRRRFGQQTDTSQEKVVLHAFQAAHGEELQLKCVERGGKTLEMPMEMVEIQKRYTQRAVQAVRTEESEVATHLKAMGERLEALLGKIRDKRKQQKKWAARRESTQRR